MSSSPCPRSGLYVGPTTTVQNVGEVVVIPGSVTGGKRIKRLVSVLLVVETVNGQAIVLTPATIDVILNGSRSTRYADLASGDCLLDKTVNNRIVFKDAFGSNVLIWMQVILEDQQKKAYIVPT